MENRRLLSISLPFVAGVACGALYTSQLSLFVVVFCLGALTLTKKYDKWVIPLMLFALGLFCYSSRCPIGVGQNVNVIAERVRGLIDSIPFEDGRTGPLLRALMTGDRSGLDRETVSAFRRSGASHLLALSGLHLGIIALFIRYLLMILGNSRPAEIVRAVLLVSFCLAYTIACGASPSLVRALLFIILQQLAALSPGRRCLPADRLCIAGTIQLALDPGAISSVAFQLSYLAMLGIVFIVPRLEAWYPSTRLSARIDPLRRIWKGAAVAIACQVTTAPVALLRFGYFPQYFLLTNLLAMPVCGVLLPLALLTLLLGCPPPLVWITDKTATLLLYVLEIIAAL
ncbi:MAG: ComEC/Rec2 family competence protein [Bacteroidales bacterium]|nr:ComEC/Rec2 family competence protein [Bacteroidales bacterium]